FVKYEFWNNYISELGRKDIPLYLISAIFRPGQHFFRWYGAFFRGILRKFTHFFVQDGRSVELLNCIGIGNVTLAGDTRFDRVMQISGAAGDISVIDDFRGGERLFLAGSSWKEDEEIIAEYINRNPGKLKWVFAPHEVEESNINRLGRLLKVRTVRFSEYGEGSSGARVLIMDNVGMLSSAYRYAFVASIGGGFGKGIHNVLEAACWGVPVLFGPNYRKFREAVDLIESGGAVSFSDYEGFEGALERWIRDDDHYKKASEIAGNYVEENTGATAKIVTFIMAEDINRQH
ncbi:MAG TPA: glycosyltransferase N-terminal domain-containing protein, partial [Bacteroidales bacterium]|nr:glycosyltransferase N-terminal domain-containing protein [Bacteroidales bacterium]